MQNLVGKLKKILGYQSIPWERQIIFFQENSLGNILRQRIYLSINLFRYYIVGWRASGQKTKNLKTLRNSYISHEALVAANGPSLLKLNFEKLSEAHTSKELIIFGINYSPLFDVGVIPDFLVLSDHYMHPRNMSPTNIEFWDKVKNCVNLRLISPVNWCNTNYFTDCASGICLHFNDLGAEGLIKGTNPIHPRGYLSVTALKALAISEFFGFKEIGVIGLDNTFYKGLQVNEKLEMIENAHHASIGQHFNSNLGNFWKLGVSDYFYFVSLNFYYLKKYFYGRNFVNLDKNSLVDAFPKETHANSNTSNLRDLIID